MRGWRPRLVFATVGKFSKAVVGTGPTGDSDEKLFVFTMGPFLFVGPAEKRSWTVAKRNTPTREGETS